MSRNWTGLKKSRYCGNVHVAWNRSNMIDVCQKQLQPLRYVMNVCAVSLWPLPVLFSSFVSVTPSYEVWGRTNRILGSLCSEFHCSFYCWVRVCFLWTVFDGGNEGVTNSPCHLSESISKVQMALGGNERRYKASLFGFDLDSLVVLSFSLLLPQSSNSKNMPTPQSAVALFSPEWKLRTKRRWWC